MMEGATTVQGEMTVETVDREHIHRGDATVPTTSQHHMMSTAAMIAMVALPHHHHRSPLRTSDRRRETAEPSPFRRAEAEARGATSNGTPAGRAMGVIRLPARILQPGPQSQTTGNGVGTKTRVTAA